MSQKRKREDVEKLIEDNYGEDNGDSEFDSDMEFEKLHSDFTNVEYLDEDLLTFNPDDDDFGESETEILSLFKPTIAWSPIPCSSRTRAHNIVTSSPSLQEDADSITSIRDAFDLYVTSKMLDEILLCTNKNCQKNERNSKQGKIRKAEIEAFIGILLASGKCNGRKLPLKEIWSMNFLFKQFFFCLPLSRDRFQYIYSNICFDDEDTRKHRIEKSHDKFEAFRGIFDQFNAACLKYYSPGSHITVDKRLVKYRGRSPAKVHMKSKPGWCGLNMWVAADAKTAYLLNLLLYTGNTQNLQEISLNEKVVTDLIRPFYGTGRGVTTDSYFTSIPLARTLLENDITLTGTIRQDIETPKEFLCSPNRPEFSSIFRFSDDLSLLSYVPKKNFAVTFLSTEFNDMKVKEAVRKRPEIILHYNNTKGGVEAGVKITETYSCVKTTQRWPFRIFMEILDIAVLNSYIIFTTKYPEWRKNDRYRRQSFIRELAMSLVNDNVNYRQNTTTNFHKHIQFGFDVFKEMNNNMSIVIKTEIEEDMSIMTGKRCFFCPRKKDRKSRLRCSHCEKVVCKSHRMQSNVYTCPDCRENVHGDY